MNLNEFVDIRVSKRSIAYLQGSRISFPSNMRSNLNQLLFQSKLMSCFNEQIMWTYNYQQYECIITVSKSFLTYLCEDLTNNLPTYLPFQFASEILFISWVKFCLFGLVRMNVDLQSRTTRLVRFCLDSKGLVHLTNKRFASVVIPHLLDST